MDRTGIPKGDFAELKAVLGNRLSVRGYTSETEHVTVIRRHLEDLDRLPRDLLRKVCDAGLKAVLVGPGSIADLPGYTHLKEVLVTGRKDGKTFGERCGGYDGKNHAILFGTAEPMEPHVVEHEFSHALVDLMGYLDDFRVVRCYRGADILNDFYVPNGVPSRAGMEEFLVDVLAGVIIYGERFIEGYPDDFVSFVLNVALKGRAPRTK